MSYDISAQWTISKISGSAGKKNKNWTLLFNNTYFYCDKYKINKKWECQELF